MDLRKSSTYLLVLLVCINAWCTILNEVGITGEITTPTWNQTAWEDNLDANATLTEYSWDVAYSDFVTGTLRVLGVVWGLVLGAPMLFTSLGVPSFIVTTIYGAWILMWFMVVLMYWIGGRDI